MVFSLKFQFHLVVTHELNRFDFDMCKRQIFYTSDFNDINSILDK